MKSVRKRYIQEAVELNITAFMNLMVILVPFLLVTAVFSRLTVIELNLPALDALAKQEEKVKLHLQLVIRSDEFIIQDVTLGVIRRFSRGQDEEASWKEFSDILLEIKRRFPDEDSITLLFEKQVSYKTLIQVMDYVRSVDVVEIAQLTTYELFPNISIGDAPNLEQSTETAPIIEGTVTTDTVKTGAIKTDVNNTNKKDSTKNREASE